MKIDVCYTPELIHQFDVSDKCVVIIDILRATSCMVAGLGSGVKSVTPVATVEECEALGKEGYVMAGERGGEKLPQFQIGNSPFDYMLPELKGKAIAATTTNGTRAIELSKEAPDVIIGAFLNLSATVKYLLTQERDILLFCAGWKGKYNLEDSLFAGAICDGVKKQATFESDAVTSAFYLYESMQTDLHYYISRSNHANRLSKFGIMKDIDYCSKTDEFDIVPRLIDGKLVV
ncbi:2-phosphosulfolactate phosphatase [Roseivirga misakiensis]|uniref:Probable 2-phosphosulfolactate phosphatase n=1 Tax=Roseivirga misakiensis TaxID=1563681 RepID=A0A1E5SKM5_9BACT|nr:2-phosphosulfolactate phosphatase [Roseivirga misakiensis]OEJ99643.1 2-phosphosulfolactate phosphatase [Roseivirga misakiensis]